jgi:hypothetical protein
MSGDWEALRAMEICTHEDRQAQRDALLKASKLLYRWPIQRRRAPGHSGPPASCPKLNNSMHE